jgi:hypothetical protein
MVNPKVDKYRGTRLEAWKLFGESNTDGGDSDDDGDDDIEDEDAIELLYN